MPQWMFGLSKGRVSNDIHNVTDACAGVIGGIIGLLCQVQHRLVCGIVTFNISTEGETPFWSNVPEILNCLLQLGGKRVFCPRAGESIIQFPPGCTELRVEAKLVHIDLGLSSLQNELQLLEATCIVLHCLVVFRLSGGSALGTRRWNENSVVLRFGYLLII